MLYYTVHTLRHFSPPRLQKKLSILTQKTLTVTDDVFASRLRSYSSGVTVQPSIYIIYIYLFFHGKIQHACANGLEKIYIGRLGQERLSLGKWSLHTENVVAINNTKLSIFAYRHLRDDCHIMVQSCSQSSAHRRRARFDSTNVYPIRSQRVMTARQMSLGPCATDALDDPIEHMENALRFAWESTAEVIGAIGKHVAEDFDKVND